MEKVTQNPILHRELKLLILIIFTFGLILRILLSFNFYHYFIDDTYIFMRYAENCANGDGLVYNLGERVMGFTSPVYTLILSLLKLILSKVDFVLMIKFLNLLLFFLFFFVSVKISKIKKFSDLAIPIFLTYYFSFLDASVSGMETQLFISMILLCVFFFSIKKYEISSLLVGFICLIRPEGFLFALVYLLILIIYLRKIPWKGTVFSIIVILAWFCFAYNYYGTILPQSMLSKSTLYLESLSATTTLWEKHIMLSLGISDRIFLSLGKLSKLGMFFISFISTIFFLVGLFKLSKAKKPLAILGFFYILYLLFYTVGNPFAIFSWYTIPSSVCFSIITIKSVLLLLDNIKLKIYSKYSKPIFTLFCLLICISSIAYALPVRSKAINMMGNNSKEVTNVISENLPYSQSIMVDDIGYIGYYSGKRIVDLAFLVIDYKAEYKQISFLKFVSDSKSDVLVINQNLLIKPDGFLSAFENVYNNPEELEDFRKNYESYHFETRNDFILYRKELLAN